MQSMELLVSVPSTSHRVHITDSHALGSTSAAGAGAINLWVCYRLSGGPISQLGGGTFGLRTVQNTRNHYSLSAVTSTLTAGTYDVGLCGQSSDAANWNNNEWGYVSAFVAQL